MSDTQKPPLNVVVLNGCSIFRQLQLEEALLRVDTSNWCLLNTAVEPAIVMGISGKVEELINLPKIQKHPIPIIRRFSGGGTVYVDAQTYFVSFIVQNRLLKTPSYPSHIHEWAKQFYSKVFLWEEFNLLENDYVLGKHKFGGNAQYICKNRILHHTSLLWDYDAEAMDYLLIPKKAPQYRSKRNHADFLCRLSERISTLSALEEMLKNALAQQYKLQEATLDILLEIEKRTHRQSTCYVDVSSSQSLSI